MGTGKEIPRNRQVLRASRSSRADYKACDSELTKLTFQETVSSFPLLAACIFSTSAGYPAVGSLWSLGSCVANSQHHLQATFHGGGSLTVLGEQ